MHWAKQEAIEKSLKNSANRMNNRGGKGVYVHNLGTCTMSSKKYQFVSSNFLRYFLNIFDFLNIFIDYFFRFKQITVIPSIISMSLRRHTPTRRPAKFRILLLKMSSTWWNPKRKHI